MCVSVCVCVWCVCVCVCVCVSDIGRFVLVIISVGSNEIRKIDW